MNFKIFENVFPSFVQVVLFFEENTTFKPMQIIPALNLIFKDVFSTRPELTTSSNNVPNDYPRILIFDKDKGKLELSYAKADLVLDYKNEDDYFEKLIELVQKLSDFFMKNRITIVRVGFIMSCGLSETINFDDVKNRYIVHDSLEDSDIMHIAWRRRIKLGDLDLNRWIKFYIDKVNSNSNNLLIDTNTIVGNDFNNHDVKNVLKFCIEEFLANLNKLVQ